MAVVSYSSVVNSIYKLNNPEVTSVEFLNSPTLDGIVVLFEIEHLLTGVVRLSDLLDRSFSSLAGGRHFIDLTGDLTCVDQFTQHAGNSNRKDLIV